MKTSQDYSMEYPPSNRMGRSKINRTDYPGAEVRSQIVEETMEAMTTVDEENDVVVIRSGNRNDIREAVTKMAHEMDNYLFHQYHLRDQALGAIKQGNIDDAVVILERIGAM